jgi:hypothetical protein
VKPPSGSAGARPVIWHCVQRNRYFSMLVQRPDPMGDLTPDIE